MNNGEFLQAKQKFHSIIISSMHKLLVVICVYLILGQLFQHVYAGNLTNEDSDVDPYQSQHGSVWLLPDNGIYIEALQMDTDVDYNIVGAIAQAKVSQQFKNNSGLWAEGIYVFPLPENAAVNQFRMIIGERIIEGRIETRRRARNTYEKARFEGKKTSLIEQQRPNVFTTSLANIAPGESITIEFEYQQVLDYTDGYYSLRFPMVMSPRYKPRDDDKKPDSPSSGISKSFHSDYSGPDYSKLDYNPTRIHILLDTGVNMAELKSTYHDIDIKQTSESRFSISTIGENIVSDRDFELVWKPELYEEPQLSSFTEAIDIDGDNYTMLTIMPPQSDYLQQRIQVRDMIFVLDISGSMSGTSIRQAKASLMSAIESLSSVDRFNIIWFNDQAEKLSQEALVATENNKEYAGEVIDSLTASGGTEILDALKMALSERPPFSRFRQIIFLTDGNISNEAELFTVISQRLGDNRLFTIGIGSAPNAYFMRKAASLGRGTFTFIGDIDEVQDKTSRLFRKLETPALINIKLDIDPGIEHEDYEVFPTTIPDIYAGDTTTVLIKGEQIPKSIVVTGDYGNIEWQKNMAMIDTEPTTTSDTVIATAWARKKIASLMSEHHDASDEQERETIIQEITDTALKHQLVSRFTSLVAVDVTPVNDNGMLLQQHLKNNRPHGWKRSIANNSIMLAQTATNSSLNYRLGIIFLMLASFVFILKYRLIPR